MATTASTKVDINLVSTISQAGTLSTVASNNQLAWLKTVASFAYGTGASLINKQFYELFDPGSAGAKTYTNGSIPDINGTNMSFSGFKLIYVYNLASDYLTITGTAWLPNVSASTRVEGSGGALLLVNPTAAGYAITGTQTIILTPNSGNAKFEIVLIGI